MRKIFLDTLAPILCMKQAATDNQDEGKIRAGIEMSSSNATSGDSDKREDDNGTAKSTEG